MIGKLHSESHISYDHSVMSSTTSSASDESNVLSFLAAQPHSYNQLLDELSIIDGMFTEDDEDEIYEKPRPDTAGDAARNKQQALEKLAQSENKYIAELITFKEVYMTRICKWFQNTKDSKAMALRQQDLYSLFHTWDHLLNIHRAFRESLSRRMTIWGPTQLISDVLGNLHENMNIYDGYIKRLGSAIVSLDVLFRLTAFSKAVDIIRVDEDDGTTRDICYYLRAPLERTTTYAHTIAQLIQHSVPSHPDYGLLAQIAERFRTLRFPEAVGDVKRHLAVLEAARAIYNCPATVTPTRRLLLVSPLVKVNLDHPHKVSDVRTYLLYNDMLIFCRQRNPKESNNATAAGTPRLQYKGRLELVQALVRPILPKLEAEMLDSESNLWARRPIFPTFSRKKSVPSSTISSPPCGLTSPTGSSFSEERVFGFEVLVPEGNADYMVAFPQNYNGHGPIVRRRHVLRTQSLANQVAWLQSLDSVIKAVNT